MLGGPPLGPGADSWGRRAVGGGDLAVVDLMSEREIACLITSLWPPSWRWKGKQKDSLHKQSGGDGEAMQKKHKKNRKNRSTQDVCVCWEREREW